MQMHTGPGPRPPVPIYNKLIISLAKRSERWNVHIHIRMHMLYAICITGAAAAEASIVSLSAYAICRPMHHMQMHND